MKRKHRPVNDESSSLSSKISHFYEIEITLSCEMKSTNGLTMVRGVIMRKAWKPVNRIKKSFTRSLWWLIQISLPIKYIQLDLRGAVVVEIHHWSQFIPISRFCEALHHNWFRSPSRAKLYITIDSNLPVMRSSILRANCRDPVLFQYFSFTLLIFIFDWCLRLLHKICGFFWIVFEIAKTMTI